MIKKRGLVIRNSSNSYVVEDLTDGNEVTCAIRGRFRLNNIRTTNPVAVGDYVLFETDDATGSSVIVSIEERNNYIIRRSTNLSKESHIIASNVDMVFLVVTLHSPVTSYEFIDRFLVTSELYRIDVTIVLNKLDICEEDDVNIFVENYRLAGYNVILCSTVTGVGIDAIAEMMRGKKSLFSGNSGVGKSSIIKCLAPTFDIKIGDISFAHGKGRHTTTFSQMLKLSEDTYLIDTPGIKGFGILDVKNEELARYFPDLFKYIDRCQFYNCTHTHEPKCEVKRRVELGDISINRYCSYLKILEDEKDKYR